MKGRSPTVRVVVEKESNHNIIVLSERFEDYITAETFCAHALIADSNSAVYDNRSLKRDSDTLFAYVKRFVAAFSDH